MESYIAASSEVGSLYRIRMVKTKVRTGKICDPACVKGVFLKEYMGDLKEAITGKRDYYSFVLL